MELLSNLALGFGVAFTLQNLLYAFGGAVLGTLDRRAAGPRPGCHDRDAAALHLRAGRDARAHHAGRHLLRRPVRRLHHRHPDQRAGRVELGGDRDRRLPDGPPGPCRLGARRGRLGLLLCRLRGDHDRGGLRSAAYRTGLQVRPGGVLLADGAGPDRCRGARVRLAGQGDRDDPAGPAHGPDQHRRHLRHAALQLRHPRAHRRHRLRGHRHGRVRLRRDHCQPGQAGRATRGLHQGREGPVAHQAGLQQRLARGTSRHVARLAAGCAAGRRRAAGGLRGLHGREEDDA